MAGWMDEKNEPVFCYEDMRYGHFRHCFGHCRLEEVMAVFGRSVVRP